MLDHIHIQNYRLFKDLKIDKLGQVNLIAGKNNTGKTALLEAILIKVEDSTHAVSYVVSYREDFNIDGHSQMKSIFFNENDDNTIGISTDNEYGGILTIYKVSEKHTNEIYTMRFIPGDPRDKIYEIKPYQTAKIPNFNRVLFLPLQTPQKFISFLWSKIVLTPKENDLINILKIIEPNITRLAIIEDKVKIQINSNEIDPVSINRMGEGINRILYIALALISSKNKILLIDEFEVGLHHSIQKQLWEIIFKYAKEWNIQVFATTHSQDTIENFYYVADRSENKGMGNYFILNKRKDEDVKAINFDFEEMKLAIETNVELR
jgi:AAA15 family ATPase/GTPase